ncbi:hypothetical protein AMJ52_09900, partial [candidate division TA06 bacterium DG_78]
MEERLKKLESLRDAGINPYPYTFSRTHVFAQIKKDFETLSQSETVIAMCGRILTIRGHGKTIFATLGDESDKLQVYLRHDVLSEQMDLFKHFDIGDIIGVKGKVFKTKTGEITILVEEFTMLCKALRPLPEKWHGLKDVEIRYRKRYLDLIVNSVQRELFKKRAQLIALMRTFLDDRGFVEVETPILQPIYGGAAARPFRTYYNALEQDMFLRIADELYLKRLITGGYEKVYEVCRDFRNEGIDRLHNPEFTMVELYQAYTDYEGMMALTETLIEYLVTNVNSSKTLKFNNKEITFKRPFRRIKYVDSLNHKVGFDVLAATDKQLSTVCEKFSIEHKKLTTGAKVDKLFNELVRKELVEPTFAIDHPKIISPLAKVHRSNDQLVERFQFFMFG